MATLLKQKNISKTNNENHQPVRVMVFNATFNNISVMSWQSSLLVEETWRKPPTCRKSLDKLYHIMLYY
jgi:hypothetical protein